VHVSAVVRKLMRALPLLLFLVLVFGMPANGAGPAELTSSRITCCTIANLDARIAAGAPSLDSLQRWLSQQTIMQCKTPLSDEIGAELNLPNSRFSDGNWISVRKRLDLGVPTYRSPPFRVPPYLLHSMIHHAVGKLDRPPFVLYLAYDPALRAVLYYQIGNEFESIGYISGVTAPPVGTPQIKLRNVIKSARVVPGDLLRDAVRGLPSYDDMTRRYGKPKNMHPQCGLLQLGFVGPKDGSYNPNRPNLTFADLAYSPEGTLRAFDLVEAES